MDNYINTGFYQDSLPVGVLAPDRRHLEVLGDVECLVPTADRRRHWPQIDAPTASSGGAADHGEQQDKPHRHRHVGERANLQSGAARYAGMSLCLQNPHMYVCISRRSEGWHIGMWVVSWLGQLFLGIYGDL